jgi:hypothetical protein
MPLGSSRQGRSAVNRAHGAGSEDARDVCGRAGWTDVLRLSCRPRRVARVVSVPRVACNLPVVPLSVCPSLPSARSPAARPPQTLTPLSRSKR